MPKKKNLAKEAKKKGLDIIRLWESGETVEGIAKMLGVCKHATMDLVAKFVSERKFNTIAEKDECLKRILKELHGSGEEDS